jgi:hypothetical protein
MLDQLANGWAQLVGQSEQIWLELERAKAEATSRGNDTEKWQIWLADLLNELKASLNGFYCLAFNHLILKCHLLVNLI